MKKPTDGNRDGMINWRLGNMHEIGRCLNDLEWNESDAAKENKYLRINGEGIRAVSLKDESPLCGFGKSEIKKIGTERTIDRIRAVIQKAISDFSDTPKDLEDDVFISKKERRLQAHIIKAALQNERSLLCENLFSSLGSEYNDLKFVLDEISFGDNKHKPIVRVDIFAVARKGQDVFPVFIELKSNRDLGRLKEQLINAVEQVTEDRERQQLLSALIKELTGLQINSTRVDKILVWPTGQASKPSTYQEIKDAEVTCVEYSPQNFSSPSEIKFCLR